MCMQAIRMLPVRSASHRTSSMGICLRPLPCLNCDGNGAGGGGGGAGAVVARQRISATDSRFGGGGGGGGRFKTLRSDFTVGFFFLGLGDLGVFGFRVGNDAADGF